MIDKLIFNSTIVCRYTQFPCRSNHTRNGDRSLTGRAIAYVSHGFRTKFEQLNSN